MIMCRKKMQDEQYEKYQEHHCLFSQARGKSIHDTSHFEVDHILHQPCVLKDSIYNNALISAGTGNKEF